MGVIDVVNFVFSKENDTACVCNVSERFDEIVVLVNCDSVEVVTLQNGGEIFQGESAIVVVSNELDERERELATMVATIVEAFAAFVASLLVLEHR